MSVFYSHKDLPKDLRHGVITIGNFDGVHKGHQALLERLCALKNNRPAGVLAFSPHPVEYLYPEKELFRLSSDQQKIELLHKYGADFVVLQKINHEFLSLSPKEFIIQVLERDFACQDLIIGDDFRFGSQALGSIKDLKDKSFNLHVVPAKKISQERCTSTLIRSYLSQGKLDQANKLLSRYFSLTGQVVSGQALARSLGFNTANIIPPSHFNLARGVYASITRIGDKFFNSATNVGVRPSVSAGSMLSIETHVINQNLDLNNCQLEIYFVARIRDEKKFDSLENLQTQVHQDIAFIDDYFKNNKKSPSS